LKFRYLLMSAGLLSACAEEREPINRVQPYALKKSDFVGKDLQGAQDDPEFWTQATLIDVGYGAAQDGLFTSTYAQPVSRIKWQVTEDMLLGRIAYERIDDSDGKGLGGPVQDGVIAVAFAIESHFDIMNDYNSATGEKLNVVSENSSDRPWYEREHFRVDFSKNLATDSYDFDTLSMLGVYGGITYEPMAYDITDPEDPNAPVFDLQNGYFDVTNRAFARPQMVDLSHLGWGIASFPACFLSEDFSGGTGPAATCNPVELTLRHSFRKVEDNDFEPADWDGHRFQAYGAFTIERHGYTRNFGMSDDKWHRFISRYNIWERSHYYANPSEMTGEIACFTPETTPYGEDPHRDEDGNGTEDECEAVTDLAGAGGSRCDTFKQRCTLPFQVRVAKPVVWYYTRESDHDYYEPTRLATLEWDVAMRVAVRSIQFAECESTGGENCLERFPVYFGQQDENDDAVSLTREVMDCRLGLAHAGQDCDAVASSVGKKRKVNAAIIDIAQASPMVVLCHSPVEANDPEECGDNRLPAGATAEACADAWEAPESDLAKACENALSVRMGDLRYHQVNVIPTPQTPSPWGIYTDSEDPLTGEKIAASINVWSHVNDLWSQKIVDTIRYIEGELSTEEVTDGDYVQAWAQAAQAAGGGGGVVPRMNKAEQDARMAAFTGAMPDKAAMERMPKEVLEAAKKIKRDFKNVRATLEAPSAVLPKYLARASAAAGTQVEAELMTPMVQRLMGITGLPLSSSVLDQSSLLRAGNPAFQRQIRNLKEVALAERGTCVMHEAPAPLSVTGLGDALEAKFGVFNAEDDKGVQQERAEKMRKYIARRAHYAVIVHEMGHSIGLRHNFVSSSDAQNYRPQYWQLRTRNGSVTEECTELTDDGESCVGPRYFDPVTAEERRNMIWMFMHSSVMDYAGEATQDMLGLGAYDFAAAKMFYGDTVAVFSDDTYKPGKPRANGSVARLDTFGGLLGYQWEVGDDSAEDGDQSQEIHYSQLQKNYDLITNCEAVEVQDFKPDGWNEAEEGAWHPVVDGRIVEVDGAFTRCKQQPVSYARWQDLRAPRSSEGGAGGDRVVDSKKGMLRVPYGFATDRWADLGNLAVYRHDNGADPYELFDFFISQQEINHIFDNYRRGREAFSVKGAVYRTLGRFNEKMRDGAKGLGLLRNIYEDFTLDIGYDFATFWPSVAPLFFKENILGAGIAFDHFARQLTRPEHGPHYLREGDPILRSARDAIGNVGVTAVNVPNGATGYFEDVGIGGRPVENALAADQGEYDSDYTLNAGSYYEKMFSAMLMTESVDNFISSSRTDFVDPRYRAVSLADLFPEGYRRWLANNLTGDDFIKGPRLAADGRGAVLRDLQGFPLRPIGWTSWWGSEPRVCFPADGTQLCDSYGNENNEALGSEAPPRTVVLDPQVGWEQQKFLVAWTMLYLPENQQQEWINQLRMWEIGKDADPEFANRIELHHPNGKKYVAKTFGKEVIFGRQVQMGIAARVLEYANQLLEQAYVVDPGPDTDGDGDPDWFIPVIGDDGQPIVKWDDSIAAIDPEGFVRPGGRAGCNAQSSDDCECSANRACVALERYVELPFFMRQVMDAYQILDVNPRGIY
jgi:hypothetical protein